MTSDLLLSEKYLRSLFDAFPAPVLVCDHQMVIHDVNRTARELIGDGGPVTLRRLCGNLLHCIHALGAPDGCGTTEFCGDCAVRQTVAAVASGQGRFRRLAMMKREQDGRVKESWFLVSGHPLVYAGMNLAVVTLEDVTELVELRRIVPICSLCRKVRDDEDFWHRVEDYLRRNTGLQFSHGVCPECLRQHYPEFADPSDEVDL